MSHRGRNFRKSNYGGRQSWGNRSNARLVPMNEDGTEVTEEETRGHPRGLRGRAIGFYYRDRSKRKLKGKKLQILRLSIPKPVINKIQNNLRTIEKLAKENILKTPIENFIQPKVLIKQETDTVKIDSVVIKKEINEEEGIVNTADSVVIEKEINEEETTVNTAIVKEEIEPVQVKQEFEFIKPELPSKYEDVKPGCSSTNFISTPTDLTSDYGNGERLLSLRGAGDYKYGYEDIITGTFDQKLEECLSKGIKICQTTSEIIDQSIAMKIDHENMINEPAYKKFLEFRKKLPTYTKTEQLLEVINNNQVIVISGETGCGKSTQVPQIILDDAIINQRGANVKILVTQPRRIAAISLAMRVAKERAENLGASVGYAVRLENVYSRKRGGIMFCTTGVLLVDLEINQGLTEYSHIILDEVHERDTHIDLAMCMLKKVLKLRKDLKLILMSATIDADKLSKYYDDCPMMHIEGLAYPVKDVYLEDILQMTQYQLPEAKRKQESKPWHKYVKNRKTHNTSEKEMAYRAEVGPWVESIKRKYDYSVYKTLLDPRIEELDIFLIVKLLLHICKGEPGAILVFLPGIGEITKVMKEMENSNAFPKSLYEIYPLHSKLSTLEQHKIFERPKPPIRKIIVATNIAETSITIDDIIYVLDCGKLKYSGLNVEENISTLQTDWISQANLRQRRGRAGRCQPGICYHLVTSFRAEKLAARILPELQRSNLLEPVLSIKRLRLGKAEVALKLVPDPPALTTIYWAIKHLRQLGALDRQETLTPLGWHLARLPVHPAAGKLLLLGALFGCLDRAASVAAVWSFKDPFLLVIGKEREVEKAKRELTIGEPSDHVAMSEAIIHYERLPTHERRRFAYDMFLSGNTLELLSDMKKQLGDNLKQMGFLTSGNVKSSWENRNSDNLSLFKAIVAAALYPNIATVRWLGTRNMAQNNVRIKAYTSEDGKISLHPSSVMCSDTGRDRRKRSLMCNKHGANWLVYWRKQKSTQLFLIDVTLVYTLPLVFFGELNVTENTTVSVPETLTLVKKTEQGQVYQYVPPTTSQEDIVHLSILNHKVECNKQTADTIIKLRILLDDVLAEKIKTTSNHAVQHSEFEEEVLKAVTDLITAEDECVDYYEDDDTASDTSESDLNMSF